VNATEHAAAGACPSRAARRRLAGTLGLTGGGLGIAAGIIQAVAGSRIPAWAGGKASPVPLGLLTIVLSAVALACGLGLLAKRASPGRCAALAAGLVIPAGICFTTVGMLWYLPGTLLLAATVIAVLAGPPAGVVAAVRHNWLRVLVSVLGGYEILLAPGAGAATAVLGLTGGLVVIAAPWAGRRSPALGAVLLAVGTMPFALVMWWSLIAPAAALLALAIGLPLMLAERARRGRLRSPGPAAGRPPGPTAMTTGEHGR
jgi:hypothetical protein